MENRMYDITAGDNRFYIGSAEETLAEILYTPGADGITITHTYVSQALRGRGIARNLVLAVVDLARRDRQKIIPLCSYARDMLEGKDEFVDVLAPDNRQ
jgi:uncharacterized protein